MEISKEGFKTAKGIDGSIRLLFDSSRAKECCDFAIENNIDIISLYPEVYTAKDLDPIYPISKFIKGLLLDDKVNYGNLSLFYNLAFLSVPDNGNDTVDLSSFPKLKMLACKYSQRLQGLESCSNLKSLTVSNYKSKTKDLFDLPSLNNLEYLSLIKTEITTLQGVERHSNLKKLEIFSAPKLETIAPLQALSNSLEEIQIEQCKKINDYEILGKVKSLKKIILSDSGEIKSLAFVKGLPRLEFISFWRTNVLDGNIKYCEGINYVGFDSRKHYTHKSEQFKK
ncbi:MAG TPA: leucine-rich repeat domain-containing protein [Peptococcaceae bacterium]|nr:leucine-rich repeat domain-containing protein [Peptococcaceae bacterium]